MSGLLDPGNHKRTSKLLSELILLQKLDSLRLRENVEGDWVCLNQEQNNDTPVVTLRDKIEDFLIGEKIIIGLYILVN